MPKVTRRGVFETNSSSTHSITIKTMNILDKDVFQTLFDNIHEITIRPSYFYNGEWSSFQNKSSFLLACIREEYLLMSEGYKYIHMMEKVIESVTGIRPQISYESDDYEYSTNALADNKEILENVFANEKILESFLFNPESKIKAIQMGSSPSGKQPVE